MAVVSGTVLDVNTNPIAKLLYVYRKDNGRFVGEAISNATTGAWSCTVPSSSIKYFAIVQYDAVDPYADSVALDLVLTGYPGQTTFFDRTGKAITQNGNVVLSATQAMHGEVSGYFDGTGDYLSLSHDAGFNPGTGAFSVEIEFNTSQYVTDYTKHFIHHGNWHIGYYAGEVVINGVTLAGRVDNGAWHHAEFCFDTTNEYAFVDGVLKATRARPTTADNTNALHIGVTSPLDANRYMLGYLQWAKVTPGVCRHAASYTPPTHPRTTGAPTENARIFDNLTPV